MYRSYSNAVGFFLPWYARWVDSMTYSIRYFFRAGCFFFFGLIFESMSCCPFNFMSCRVKAPSLLCSVSKSWRPTALGCNLIRMLSGPTRFNRKSWKVYHVSNSNSNLQLSTWRNGNRCWCNYESDTVMNDVLKRDAFYKERNTIKLNYYLKFCILQFFFDRWIACCCTNFFH